MHKEDVQAHRKEFAGRRKNEKTQEYLLLILTI